MARLAEPSPLKLVTEARVVLEYVGLRAALPRLRREVPRGDGSPVLVVPGFATDDSWTATLRGFLSDVGWRVRGWGLGRNGGKLATLLPLLTARVEELSLSAGAPVRLVGWSLGGYLAREVARERPEIVERVVTLGSPVVGGPKYTASARGYRRRGYDVDAIERQVRQREETPLRVRVAAVYSRSDGVVAWRACLDLVNDTVEHHEVDASHLGLIFSAASYRLVAGLLARPRAGQRTRAA